MKLPAFSIKQSLTIGGLVLVIVSCWVWIYFTQIVAPPFNSSLHQGVGQVLAEETAKLLGKKGQVVIVAISPRQIPELKAQLDSFELTLKKAGAITIKEKVFLDASDPKYGLGRGLSAKKLLHVLTKHAEANAVVSFIGAPNLTDDELEQVSKAHPKFIAEARSPERTLKLLEKQALQVAVVSRFVFPAPGRKHPRTKREWFDRYFQVITPAIAQQGASTG